VFGGQCRDRRRPEGAGGTAERYRQRLAQVCLSTARADPDQGVAQQQLGAVGDVALGRQGDVELTARAARRSTVMPDVSVTCTRGQARSKRRSTGGMLGSTTSWGTPTRTSPS
jgi:hypothetical protein